MQLLPCLTLPVGLLQCIILMHQLACKPSLQAADPATLRLWAHCSVYTLLPQN